MIQLLIFLTAIIAAGELSVLQPGPMSPCQRYNFTPTPSQVGWDTVVVPSKLDIGACWGYCPMPAQSPNSTFGRVLTDRFRVLNPTLVPLHLSPSCCTPKSYKPITVLESTPEGEIQLMNITDLSIKDCGCS